MDMGFERTTTIALADLSFQRISGDARRLSLFGLCVRVALRLAARSGCEQGRGLRNPFGMMYGSDAPRKKLLGGIVLVNTDSQRRTIVVDNDQHPHVLR